MPEIVKRAITGAVYVALVIGAAWAGTLTTFLLFLPVCIIAAREWQRLALPDYGPIENMLLATAAYIAIASIAFVPQWDLVHTAALLLPLLLLLIAGLLLRGTERSTERFAMLCAMVFYIALPFGLVTHFVQRGPLVFIGFMLLLWTNDTGAYLIGRAIGRHKLMPAVSPGKTIEGFLGGALLTMLLARYLSTEWTVLSPAQWIVGAGALAVAATLGDLLESAFKRARGVKDSGTLLPGHGGILDRFDGFLLAAPAMWLVICLVR